MGVLIPVGFGQAFIPFTLTGISREMGITFGFDAPASPNPELIADDILANFTGTTAPFAAGRLRTNWTAGPCRVQIQTEPGILSGTGTLTVVGTNGTGGGSTTNVAALVQKRTGVGGRRNRGRWYQPPVNFLETEVDEFNLLSTTRRDDMQTRYDVALAAMDLDGYGIYLLHSQPGAPTRVTSLVVQRLVATQRRRLRP